MFTDQEVKVLKDLAQALSGITSGCNPSSGIPQDAIPIRWLQRLTVADGSPNVNACLVLFAVIREFDSQRSRDRLTDGFCQTTHEALSAIAGVTPRQVAYAIDLLVRYGLVEQDGKKNAVRLRPNSDEIRLLTHSVGYVLKNLTDGVKQGDDCGSVVDVDFTELTVVQAEQQHIALDFTDYAVHKPDDSTFRLEEKPPQKAKKNNQLSEQMLEEFLNVYNRFAPKKWTRHRVIPLRARKYLEKWIKRHGSNALQRWETACKVAQVHEFYGYKTQFDISGFCSNDKPQELYDRYEIYQLENPAFFDPTFDDQQFAKEFGIDNFGSPKMC